jgi:hypothetical protein
LQKNGRDAEHHAEPFADLRAVACAEKIVPMQKAVQKFVQR